MFKNMYYLGLVIIFIVSALSLYFVETAQAGSPTPILINEVMYHPADGNEWIELYNPTSSSVNVEGWTLYDGQDEDRLEGDLDHGNGTTIIPPGGYAIVTHRGTGVYETPVSEDAVKLYVDDNDICGYGLNNVREKLLLNTTSRRVVDAVEWGYNYSDVPGSPGRSVNKGDSFARYPNRDTNVSALDFYYGIIPTPGYKNQVDINISLYTLFIPKVESEREYSAPFSIKIDTSNLLSNETYLLKSCVAGDISCNFLATQTWNGTCWRHSNVYTSIFATDNSGNWSGWQHIRFKKDYKGYKEAIENNATAYLIIKIKKDEVEYEVLKKIFLLDMDESTSNGTRGGYIFGRAEKNLSNNAVVVENKTGVVTGVYFTEDNGIVEGWSSKPGYYKVSSPVDSGYMLTFLDNNGSMVHSVSDIDVEQGSYKIEVESPKRCYLVKRNETVDIPLVIKNTGDFSDIFVIKIESITRGWNATLERDEIFLSPNETFTLRLQVVPCQRNHSCELIVSSTSRKDMGAFNKITVEIEVLAPDLTVTDILCHDRSNQKNMVFGEGEIISIKAYVKNIGNDNATGFNVSFYYDFKNKEHLIERKYYKGIGRHRKYPSVRWDTKNMKPGWHTIFVVVDEENNVEERDETNNEFSIDVKIFKTTPSGNILITEIYYHTHANVRNEYIAIYNPSDTVEDVSGWYITDEPGLNMERQTKVVFPSDTVISPGEFLYLTQNASAFQKETGRLPDFEYMMDSREDVAQMQVCKRFTLSNKGGLVALKDRYNHTIDVVVYGEFYYNSGGWKGPPVEGSGCGNVLKRVFHLGEPVDTDSRGDWSHPRVYGIGQSNFEVVKLRCKGEIKMFVSPDCSFDTIIEELKKAQESIYLNIYEFTNHLLCNEIINALKRNVSVYIFLESNPVGNIDDNEIYILDRISANGGKIRFRVNDPEHGVYARYRLNHAKYLIIDNATVVVGSFNWGSTGLPENPRFGNREWGVVVRNEEIAEYFLKVFLDDWNPLRCDSYSFNDMDFSVPPHVIDEPMPSGIYEPCFDSKTITANFSATPVFSPDTSEEAICNLIEAANHSIYIEQLYIFKNWSGRVSPFVEKLVNKSKQGVEVKVLMNYNPDFKITSDKCMETKRYLEENNITVRFLYTNWSYFTSLHTKGMIVDNKSVVIASINWNENSVTKNRESGIIIENKGVARYYAEVFFHDWRLKPPGTKSQVFSLAEYKNPFLIVIIYGITFALVARDWRRRKWT